MCGLLALANVDVSRERKDRALLRMRLRGPDQDGQWESVGDRVWLGHRRLSIVDLSEAGRQPMHSADGRLSIVFNGEIYNYARLRRKLEGRGHRFLSRCDTEVLLHAYREWGLELFAHLQGMFAFALWDRDTKRLLAARDHLGIKPLFYAGVDVPPVADSDGNFTVRSGKGLVFGSDMNAMQVLLPQSPSPDPMAVSYLLTLGFIPEPRTIWREIRRLPAGHYLTTVDHGPPEIRRYWEPPSELDSPAASGGENAGASSSSRARAVESQASAWEALFKEVAQEHLLADTPIALFLSGGLDSTAVAACLHDLDAPLEALTIGFPGAKRDESAIASATAAHLKLPHRVIPLDKPDPLALIREVMHAVDEPLGASGPLSKYKICQAAHEAGYKVVFGGDGGDEVFCGYPRFWDMEARLSPAMAAVRPLVRWTIERFGQYPVLVNPAAKAYGRQDILSRHRWRLFPRYLPEEAERLLAPMGQRFSDADMLAPYLKHYSPHLPPQRAMQRIDLMTYCADGELSRIDKVSMAHSLEWRVPMLDRRVVEFGLSQPYTVNARQESKPVIRDYLRTRVPDAVLNAPKRGFSIDNMDQLDRDEAHRLIDAGPWIRNGYWRRDWHYLVQPDMPYALARLSLLLMLTLWAENQPCLQ